MKKFETLQYKKPSIAITIFVVIGVACILANIIAPYDSDSMDSAALNAPPGIDHIFGTDTLGRDLFSMILYGSRASLFIGIVAALISTVIAVIYGCISGLANEKVDDVMMRFAEMFMSIPSILIIIFLQALWGEATLLSLAVVIGITGWMNISKIVRSEVRQIGSSDYILAARSMGGSFIYILWRHLLPNFISSIMFMVVTNVGAAIATEATLSFLGLGLPLTTISWGSLMSMSQEVLLSNCWWIIIIPGIFLITTLVCITDIGEYIRRKNNKIYSNL